MNNRDDLHQDLLFIMLLFLCTKQIVDINTTLVPVVVQVNGEDMPKMTLDQFLSKYEIRKKETVREVLSRAEDRK